MEREEKEEQLRLEMEKEERERKERQEEGFQCLAKYAEEEKNRKLLGNKMFIINNNLSCKSTKSN